MPKLYILFLSKNVLSILYTRTHLKYITCSIYNISICATRMLVLYVMLKEKHFLVYKLSYWLVYLY